MSHLSRIEQRKYLQYARDTIAWKLGLRDTKPDFETQGGPFGAFVTLKKSGELRGCIGNIVSERPLSETIRDMALSAAFRDPRFPPLKVEEFRDLSIEISVLSPLERVKDTSLIEPGRDGLLIRNGYHSGLLLPQVATEQNWDRETFIEHTFYKAGLSPDFLEDDKTEIYSFTAEVFSENDLT
ncbi:AmmeMemoRadiSam system protein A [Spirochaeta isovalerica]|uniref:AmmeMemoRadiSam system protein A n=1 Tax=Spirochaeta isovalerica TaxID=150 RepID=A0A841R4U2_9SPIO|nr:AmmeMemoRadiSam system protein A [Spirochaeta isovalerica]MBB6478885.1 AmmeMemoRadiSam system protein A [Spirochaeta isovalerica]